MKHLKISLLLLLSPAAMANWSLQHFPVFTEQDSGIFVSNSALTKGEYPLKFYQNKQCWQPTGPVKMVVAYPAGGPTDIVARLLGQKFGEAWGQQVVIDNRSGGGTVGMASSSTPQSSACHVSSIRLSDHASSAESLPRVTAIARISEPEIATRSWKAAIWNGE